MKRINMKQAAASLAGLALAGALAVGGALPAHADSDTEDYNELRDWFSSYGVAAADQDVLVARVASGEILDSMKATSTVISTQQIETSAATEVVTTFADHSISVGSIEKPQAPIGIQPRAIAGCTTYTGGGFVSYANCTISESNGTTTMSFKADYSRSSGGASISNWRDANATARYGSATVPTLTAIRTSAQGSTPAVVTSYSRFTSQTGGSSEDLYLSLRVTAAQAWTTTY